MRFLFPEGQNVLFLYQEGVEPEKVDAIEEILRKNFKSKIVDPNDPRHAAKTAADLAKDCIACVFVSLPALMEDIGVGQRDISAPVAKHLEAFGQNHRVAFIFEGMVAVEPRVSGDCRVASSDVEARVDLKRRYFPRILEDRRLDEAATEAYLGKLVPTTPREAIQTLRLAAGLHS
jgi:hypothetical protein